jgi:hypothetical protein
MPMMSGFMGENLSGSPRAVATLGSLLMTQIVRVFVNAAGLDVPAGSTALEAVRAWKTDEADGIVAGRRVITDSRGLPLSPDAPLAAGAILRVVANREDRAS